MISTIQNDIVLDYIGTTVLNPDKVIQYESGGKGIELFADILRDAEVSASLQTRKLAVVGKEWEILPASDDARDIEIADFVKTAFLRFDYDSARIALLSGIVLGYKPAEVLWEYDGASVWIKDIVGRASRRFVFDLDGNLRMLTFQDLIAGIPLPERKFVVFRNISSNGSYYGDGLGSKLYWPVWFRKNGIKFWAIFCDKFGSPTPIGKYPAGTPKELQKTLLKTLEAIQQESAVTIPDNIVIELLEATRSGTAGTYESFCAYMDKSINKIVLGHGSAIESTPGKLGSETQVSEVRGEFLKADADLLCSCQNKTIIPWLVDYNFPDVKQYPQVWIRTDEEKDLKPIADRDLILARDIRLPMTKKYFYETYGIPKPQEGEELVEIYPPPAPDSGGQNTSGGGWQGMNYGGRQNTSGAASYLSPSARGIKGEGFTERKCPHCFADKGIKAPDIMDKLTENAQGQANLDPSIEQIKKLSNEVGSLEELRDRLLDIYQGMDPVELGNLMQKAFTVADLAGRYRKKK